MASVVDICNLALARLGDRATVSSIDPVEGSAQAEHCARFYPQARDTLLSQYPWSFALRRAALTPYDTETIPAWTWAHAYAKPNGALRILAVLPPTGEDDESAQPFEVESLPTGAAVLYTDQPDAHARYIARVTDTAVYTPLFIEALSWLLASHLAGPLIKGKAGMEMAQACYQYSMLAAGQARQQDASERMLRPARKPGWISAR